MRPTEPDPVKLFVGILYTDSELLQQAMEALVETFGGIDYKSPEFEFNISEYYREEMGWPIFRKFVSFGDLINPGDLAEIKIVTNRIEDGLEEGERRRVNLDPGYMDYNKVILSSAKYNAQKVYLSQGIYADPTLWFENGDFHPYPFSFPDFGTGLYNKTFVHIRALFKGQRRKLASSSNRVLPEILENSKHSTPNRKTKGRPSTLLN
jgi:hypothetical protein